MKYFFSIFVLFIFSQTYLFGQDEQMYSDKSLVITLSTKDYNQSILFAEKLSKKMSCKLNLRGLQKHETRLLTFDSTECSSNYWEYPCYVARGRYDDGAYLSVESSTAYEGFTSGYYIVVFYSGEPRSDELTKALNRAKLYVPDAYVKNTRVYMGCMH